MNSKPSSSNSSKKDEKILQGIDFNVVSKDARGNSSFNMKSSPNLLNVENKIRSSSFIDKGLRGLNNSNNLDKNIILYDNDKDNNINKNEVKNQYTTVEKAIISLEQVDLNGVLESINFDNISQNNKNEFNTHANISIKSGSSSLNNSNTNTHSLNRSFDYIPTSSYKSKFTETSIPSTDFSIPSNTKINSTNLFKFNENILRKSDKSVTVEHGKKNYDISNFENLLHIGTSKDEDIFDKSLIRKQVRGVIIV
jgi:hypothetical protein